MCNCGSFGFLHIATPEGTLISIGTKAITYSGTVQKAVTYKKIYKSSVTMKKAYVLMIHYYIIVQHIILWFLSRSSLKWSNVLTPATMHVLIRQMFPAYMEQSDGHLRSHRFVANNYICSFDFVIINITVGRKERRSRGRTEVSPSSSSSLLFVVSVARLNFFVFLCFFSWK
jgi:hypothetical protein